MSMEADAPPVGEVIHRNMAETSVVAAARALADARAKEQETITNPQQEPAAPGAPEAAPQPEPEKSASQEADAAPPEEATGETQEADPAPAPSLKPPRSWSKETHEKWAKLDRDTQQYLLDRDSKDSSAIRKAQNEAAERSKALQAKETAAEQSRAQYEGALPMLLQALQEQQQGEFADIKSIADVEKMAREDWPRYVLWDAQQKKVAAVAQQVQIAQQRQEHERLSKWQTFAKDQDALFREKAPELEDKDAMTKAASSAADMLKDLGFSDDELGRMWNGNDNLSLRDHRVQLLIRDGVRYREAQAAAKKVTAAPKPPVQRPGAAPSKATSIDAQIQALSKQMANASSMQQVKLAAQITSLQREAAARRA